MLERRWKTCYSKFETCFSCHAWDLTIHDLFLLKTVMADISNSPRPSLSSFMYRTRFYHRPFTYIPFTFSFPLSFSFFSLQTPHHFIPFTWFTHSDLTIQSTIISSLLMSKRTTTSAMDYKLVHSIRILAWLFTFWFISVVFFILSFFFRFKILLLFWTVIHTKLTYLIVLYWNKCS